MPVHMNLYLYSSSARQRQAPKSSSADQLHTDPCQSVPALPGNRVVVLAAFLIGVGFVFAETIRQATWGKSGIYKTKSCTRFYLASASAVVLRARGGAGVLELKARPSVKRRPA